MARTLTLQSSPSNLKYVEPFLSESVRGVEMSDAQYSNAVIALTEAVNNCIVHGNQSDVSKHVVITIDVDSTHLTMSVDDEGEGFNPDDLPDPLDPENLMKSGGRGVFIMRAIIEQVDFFKTETGARTFLKMPLQ